MPFSFIREFETLRFTVKAQTDVHYILNGTIILNASPAFHFGTATNTSLTSNSDVFGSNAIVSASTTTSALSLTLNEGSSATGILSAVFLGGINGQITNMGSMTGLGRVGIGLFNSAESFSINNGGTVSGATYGMDLRGTGHEILNSGEITAAYGLHIRSDDTAIANTGTIIGRSEATLAQSGIGIHIEEGASGVEVVNSGLVTGGRASFAGNALENILQNDGLMVGNVLLGAGDDSYFATPGGTVLGRVLGGDGSDFLSGGDARDFFRGGADYDRIYGRNGDDELEGGDGGDLIVGGAGDDMLNGEEGDDRLYGGDGDDHLIGDNAYDPRSNPFFWDWDGTSPEPTLSFDDRLMGGNGNDILEGRHDSDMLFGGDGNDILIGGSGRDVQFSGSGNDTFVFNRASDSTPGSRRDTIRDFETGMDRLDFTEFEVIDESRVPPADGPLFYRDATLSFIGTEAFSGAGLEMRYVVTAAGSSVIRVDTDGDGQAEMEVLVQGVSALGANDFLL